MSLQAPSPAQAQSYPTRQITFIVPLPPGGTLDPITRTIAAKLADRLGHPVIVENRPGAGTMIGTAAAARSAPDGYTFLMGGTAALAVHPTLFTKPPYDPVKDFEPIALLLRVPFVLVVNPSLPVRSLSELVKLATEKPGQLFYASAGPGTQPHLAMELLKSETGMEMIHVPYKGAMSGLLDVLAGRVQLMFADPASALAQIKAGKLRALGISSRTRMKAAPDIPPIAEAGIPGFEAVLWIMVVAPAHTPEDIVSRMHSELKRVMALPEVQRMITDAGVIPVDSPPPARLRDFIKSEIVRWRPVVERARLAGSR